MPVVNNVVYCPDGRALEPASLDVTYELLREHDGLAWIALAHPTDEEIGSVAAEFSLHHLVVEDALSAHQRPKVERFGDTLVTVLRPARWVGGEARLDIGELHVFTGADFVVTVRHGDLPDVAAVRARWEADPDLVAGGPEAVLYALIDRVVDGYGPVVDELESAVDAVEADVFDEAPDVGRSIQRLFRELAGLLRAVRPLPDLLAALRDGFDEHGVELELRRLLRDVDDHVVRLVERIDALRHLLETLLGVSATLVAQRQNVEIRALTEATFEQSEQVKRISSWAAVLFAPTLVPTIYGMNFEFMPELDEPWGYPFALTAMVLMFLGLLVAFRRRGWI